VRLLVGNGGPNLASNFHVIGEIFDTVHEEGASEGTSNVQTTLIPAGGAAFIEFTLEVPGTYTLVDHALSRAIDKGAVAQIVVEGEASPEVFDAPAGQAMTDH
jgi:nitrite reductase (NO-forming)